MIKCVQKLFQQQNEQKFWKKQENLESYRVPPEYLYELSLESHLA